MENNPLAPDNAVQATCTFPLKIDPKMRQQLEEQCRTCLMNIDRLELRLACQSPPEVIRRIRDAIYFNKRKLDAITYCFGINTFKL